MVHYSLYKQRIVQACGPTLSLSSSAQALDVSCNRLRRLPPELGRLTRLQALEMGGQQAGPSPDINGGTQVRRLLAEQYSELF